MKEQERRKERRVPITLHLEVSHMFRQNHEVMEGIDAEIIVTNISKSGIAFVSQTRLPLGYYFNAKIKLDRDDFFYSVVKVLREGKSEEQKYIYGAEFVGLAPFLSDKIATYEHTINERCNTTCLNN